MRQHLLIKLTVVTAVAVATSSQAVEPPANAKNNSPPRTTMEEPTGPLTLREALRLASLANPGLSAFSWDIRAAEARRIQAGLLPNPVLGAELENFAGSGVARGVDIAEATVQLSQLIELGSKRRKRVRVAALGRTAAELDYEAKRLEVFRAVAQEFITVLAAQRRLVWAEESLRLTEKFAPSAEKRVEAGAASKVELMRFNLQIATARIERDQTNRDLASARKRLSALWGSSQLRFDRAVGDLETLPAAPPLETADRQLGQTPTWKRWESELARRQAAIELEQANAVPDVTVGAGVRYLNEPSDGAAVAQVSIPLPLFNRNEGAIREARAFAARAGAERRATEVQLHTSLRVSYDDLTASAAQIKALKETILPLAKEAFEKVNEGYLAGRFTYLEVVDAQNSLIQANVRYIEVLAAYHQAISEIEGLTGQPLGERFAEPATTPK